MDDGSRHAPGDDLVNLMQKISAVVVLGVNLLAHGPAWSQGQEMLIKKNLSERLSSLPRIEEVRRTPMSGLYEVRTESNEIYYTDPEGNYLLQGELIDVRQKRNLTEERIDKLSAIEFSKLPFKDAFTIVQGNGQRKLAVFVDPNCGYCKRFERDLEKLDNVTIHVFLYPILGADSVEKARNIWCAKDRSKSWRDWMLNAQKPLEAKCDTAAVDRNVEFGHKNRITGTPTSFAANGNRIPGALPLSQLQSML
jgi:thiol:disulfide interchange protein DsbC